MRLEGSDARGGNARRRHGKANDKRARTATRCSPSRAAWAGAPAPSCSPGDHQSRPVTRRSTQNTPGRSSRAVSSNCHQLELASALRPLHAHAWRPGEHPGRLPGRLRTRSTRWCEACRVSPDSGVSGAARTVTPPRADRGHAARRDVVVSGAAGRTAPAMPGSATIVQATPPERTAFRIRTPGTRGSRA